MTFTLQSAEQIGAAVIRVTISQVPISSDPRGPRDATNALNWVLTGSGDAAVDMVRVVSGDPFAYDLILAAPLAAGSWHLRALDIQTKAGLSLVDQIVDFVAVNAQDFFTDARDQLTGEDDLRQHLNAALDGPGWRAWTAAVGYGIEQTRKTAEAAFRMKWLQSSVGDYLERNANSYGLSKPADVGVGDDVFRQLAMSLNANKINRTALESVLLAFYGIDGTQAYAQAGVAEPYALTAGDKLFLGIDGTSVEIEFSDTTAFTSMATAEAMEVAAAINRRFALLGLRALASASYNPTDGGTYLRIYSGYAGLRGKIQFFGGQAWDAFRFPSEPVTTQVAGTQWEYRLSSSTNGIPEGRARLIWTGGGDPGLANVYAGHWVNIWGANFSAVNRGIAEIIDSSTTYVEFAAPVDAANQATVLQIGARDVFFVVPELRTLHDTLGAYVSQAGTTLTEIFLPATSSAVSRTISNAWYLNGETPIALDGSYAASRAAGSNTVTIGTESAHGLTAGRYFWLDDVEIDYEASLGAVQVSYGASPVKQRCYSATKLDDGNVMAVFSNGGPAPHSHYIFDVTTNTWSAPVTTPFMAEAPALCRMADGRIFGVDGDNWSIFDPDSGSWTSLAPHGFSSIIAAPYTGARLLLDDRILVVGAGAENDASTWVPITNMRMPDSIILDVAYGGGAFVAVGIASTAGSGASRSTDDGVTWATLNGTGIPAQPSWYAVAYGNGTFIAAGFSAPADSTYRSTDNGATWSQGGNLSVPNIFSLTYGDGVFVAGSLSGAASRSTDDGLTWSATNATGFGAFSVYGAAASDTSFVLVGGGGSASRSVDGGINWTVVNTQFGSDNQNDIAYGDGVYVAVGVAAVGGSRSTDDGVTWTLIGDMQLGGQDATSVAYGNGIWVAGSSGGNGSYSTDAGVTWTPVVDFWPGTTACNSIAYGAKNFVAVSQETAVPVTSASYSAGTGFLKSSIFNPATQTWSAEKDIDTDRLNNLDTVAVVTSSGDAVLAGGGSGNGANPQAQAYFYSIATDAWSDLQDMPAAIGLPRGVFVPQGPGGQVWVGGTPATSLQVLDVTTRTWTSKSLVGTNTELDLVESLGRVYSVSAIDTASWELFDTMGGLAAMQLTDTTGPGATLGTANNPLIWEAIADTDTAATASLNGIAYGSSSFVIVGYLAANCVASRSTDGGLTWTNLAGSGVPAVPNWTDVRYGNGIFMAIGSAASANTAYTSADDGATWAAGGAATANSTGVLAYGNSVWVTGGTSGTASRSTDNGTTWSATGATGFPAFHAIRGAAYGGGAFMFVGGGAGAGTGRAARSIDDGLTWAPAATTLGTTRHLCVAYGGGVFITAGESGLASRSIDNGATWSAVANMHVGTDDIRSLTYGNGIWVAVCYTGIGSFSVDGGVTWTAIDDLQFGGIINDVVYGSTSFVAIGADNKASISSFYNTTAGYRAWSFKLDDGRILATAQDDTRTSLTVAYVAQSSLRTRSGGFLSGFHKVVTAPDSTTLTFATPDSDAYTRITAGTLTPVLAEAGTLSSGYLLDTKTGISFAAETTELTAAIEAGIVPGVISVGSTLGFDDEPGYLVLDFGYKSQLVLRYLGTASGTQLRMAPGQTTTNGFVVGTKVDTMLANGPWSPATGVGLTAAYLTGSAAGRREAASKLSFASAVGLPIVHRVVYPGDRGLGNEGLPKSGVEKITDAVGVWGGNEVDVELQAAREDDSDA